MKKSTKRIYKSRDDKILAGVCSGFAEYVEMDPTIVRLIFILLLLITGVVPLTIFYIIAAIIVPEK